MRELTDLEARRIGFALGEPLVLAGHPLTCNGGNDDASTRHDHEVKMLLKNNDELICPECGREQGLPFDWNYDD